MARYILIVTVIYTLSTKCSAATLISYAETIKPAVVEPPTPNGSGSAVARTNNLVGHDYFSFRQSAELTAPIGNYGATSGLVSGATYLVETPSTVRLDVAMDYNFSPGDHPLGSGVQLLAPFVIYGKYENFHRVSDAIDRTKPSNGGIHYSRTFSLIPGEYYFGLNIAAGVGAGGSLSYNATITGTLCPSCAGLGFKKDRFDPLGYVESYPPYQGALDPVAKQRVAEFENLIEREFPAATFDRESGFRPVEYQAHLYEIRELFQALDSIPGIASHVIGRRPQLLLDGTASIGAECQALMDEVNKEVRDHLLLSEKARVIPHVAQDSNHSKGRAVDIRIVGVPRPKIKELSERAKLDWPLPESDDVHFQLPSGPIPRTIQFIGNSPINLLVTADDGRRIGFDASAGKFVNDFGTYGTYSGVGIEPQIIQIEYENFSGGGFDVSGIGTGDGPYTISAQAWGEDFHGQYDFDHVIASGTASYRQPLQSVHLSVPGSSSLFLPGDFNQDGVLDAVDIDLLAAAAHNEPNNPLYDLDGDGTVTFAVGAPGAPDPSDSDVLIYDMLETRYGDADLNGQVFLSDLTKLATNYRTAGQFGWAQGNFNGSQEAGTAANPRVFLSDLTVLATNWRFGVGGGSGAAVVPEPSALLLAMCWLLATPHFRVCNRHGTPNEPRLHTKF
jgi:hypothetical protein